MKSDAYTLQSLQKLLAADSLEDISTSNLMELLCQIVLALLIIFVMANVLFTAKAKADLDEAKGMIGLWQGKYIEISKTPAGEQYKLRHKALIELQRQKLINALEKIEVDESKKYGLLEFGQIKEDGSIEFVTKDVLSGTKVVNTRFIEVCVLAKKTLPYKTNIRQEWLSRILLMESMQLSTSTGEVSQRKDLESFMNEVITKENESWLFQEINSRIENLYANCLSLQRNALAQMQAFFKENPEVLKGTSVYQLVTKYTSTPTQEQPMLVRQISEELYQYAKSVFDKQSVPLLNEV